MSRSSVRRRSAWAVEGTFLGSSQAGLAGRVIVAGAEIASSRKRADTKTCTALLLRMVIPPSVGVTIARSTVGFLSVDVEKINSARCWDEGCDVGSLRCSCETRLQLERWWAPRSRASSVHGEKSGGARRAPGDDARRDCFSVDQLAGKACVTAAALPV